LTASEIRIYLSGASSNGSAAAGVSNDINDLVNDEYRFDQLSSAGPDDDISAGSSATIQKETLDSPYIQGDWTAEANSDTLDLSEAAVRVVWQAAEGDQSAQLGQWSGPDA
jgi:hypothetical protein